MSVNLEYASDKSYSHSDKFGCVGVYRLTAKPRSGTVITAWVLELATVFGVDLGSSRGDNEDRLGSSSSSTSLGRSSNAFLDAACLAKSARTM